MMVNPEKAKGAWGVFTIHIIIMLWFIGLYKYTIIGTFVYINFMVSHQSTLSSIV